MHSTNIILLLLINLILFILARNILHLFIIGFLKLITVYMWPANVNNNIIMQASYTM